MEPKYEAIVEKIKDVLLDEKKRAYVIISAAVVFSALYIYVLIVPGVKTFSILTKASVKTATRIVSAKKKIAKLEDTEKRLNVLKSEFSAYDEQIPGKKEIALFLDSLAATARNSKVRILGVTPISGRSASAETGEIYSSIMVVIKAKGGYHGIRNFVGELEGGRGFSSIRDIRVRYDSKSPTRHDAHIVLKMYVSPKAAQYEKKK